MKKLILLFGAVAILLAACSDMFGGSDGVNGSDGVRDKIGSAKDGDTISLHGYDDEKSRFIVTAKDLTLVDANMPNTTIVVSEEIKDANFTLKNCVFKALEVNGGGSNSVHIKGGKVEKVIAKKEKVRIVLEEGVAVADLSVEADCTLDADDNANNAVASIFISKTVTEFKIGATSTDGSDKSIAISIKNIKLETFGEGEGNVKIVVKNPTIVEDTIFSSDMSDKVVDSEEKKIPVQTVTDDGYTKLPLKVQEKFLHFPADSDGWSYGITVESKEDGEMLLIKNENPVSESVFNIGANINMPYNNGEKGKSYIINFDLKANADCYVNVALEDRFFSFSHPSVYCKLSTEWKTFELHTGILYENWSEYTNLIIEMGNASEVEIKNLKIKEDENPCLPTHVYYSTTDLVDSIEVTSRKDNVEFTSYPPLRIGNESDPLIGIDIIFGVMEAGNLYKVTFDVTPDATESFVNVWGHATTDAYDTAGNAQLSFVSGVKKSITLYIPCYALPYDILDKDGKIIGSGKREKSIGVIWFSCFDGQEHAIKVENIKSEIVENIETVKQQDDLVFYVSGNVTDNGIDSATGEANYEWTSYREPNNPDDDIILMSGYGFYFEYMMSDTDGWGSKKTTITGFRYSADESITTGVDHEGNNKLYYENKQSYPVALHFGLDGQYRVTLETEDASERLATVKQKSAAWYYFEFDPSESIWANFKEDRANVWFNITYNDGENNSYGFQFPDGQNVIYKDSWIYNPIEESWWDRYEISDSKRDDNPKYDPINGKLRIYFYSDTSKLASTIVPVLKPKTPYMHVYDSLANEDRTSEMVLQ